MTRKVIKYAPAIRFVSAIKESLESLNKEDNRKFFSLYELVLIEQAADKINKVIESANERPDTMEEIGNDK
jgi:hypothetical protein